MISPQGLAVFPVFIEARHLGATAAQCLQQGLTVCADVGAETTLEALGDEPRRPARDVDVLPYQIAVHPRHEVLGIEVHILDACVELGGDVVAQPFGVHAQREVFQRVDAGAAALAHLFAADGDEAVHEDVGGHLAAAEVQHGRPEQGVEVGDVLADEVVLLHRRVGDELLERAGLAVPGLGAALAEVALQRGQVAHRRVEPHVEVLARCVGDLVPVRQAAMAVLVGGEPFLDLVGHLALQLAVLRPILQEVDAALGRELEEVVLAGLHHRRGTGERGVGVLQLGGGIDGATHLAGVAVLVLRAAFRAFTLDVAVRQEHVLHRVEELLDVAREDQPVLAQRAVDVLGEFGVLGAVGGMPVVEADVEAIEVFLAARGDLGHEGLRRLAGLLGGDHDGRAVGVVGADKVHLVALHALEAHPDVGLDVLHDVADVELAVGVGQGGGDEELAGHRERGAACANATGGKPRILGREWALWPLATTCPSPLR
jgi:hypothetical protein